MTRNDTIQILSEIAWLIYCEETAGDMDVRDNWDELPNNVQQIYLNKALNNKVPENVNRVDPK